MQYDSIVIAAEWFFKGSSDSKELFRRGVGHNRGFCFLDRRVGQIIRND